MLEEELVFFVGKRDRVVLMNDYAGVPMTADEVADDMANDLCRGHYFVAKIELQAI